VAPFEHGRDRVGALEHEPVAALDHEQLGVGEQLEHAPSHSHVLLIAPAHEQRDRHGELLEPALSPVPMPRSTAASRKGSLRRWSARASSLAAGGSPANSGWVRQRSMNSSKGMLSSTSARLRSLRRCCARPLASSIPGLAPISTSRSMRARAASATCSAIRPPIE
jgi:hypothetical protein